MQNLPEQFIENMKKQLPANEWEAFFAVYEKRPFKGVRINPLKGKKADLTAKLPFLGKEVLWEENGFYTTEEKLGNSPFHAAGLFYSHFFLIIFIFFCTLIICFKKQKKCCNCNIL